MAIAEETALARYRWASAAVNGLIQGPPSPPPGVTTEEIRRRATARLERLRAFLAFAGNPQARFRSIHVGGTSGKGSTAAFIASILSAAGYRTGLHVSPYLQVETEKLQIDGALMSGDVFATYVEDLQRLARDWVAEGGAPLTYGESWVALTFLAFAGEEVDIGVIEVGTGGRFDLTNVLLSDVAVITSVGLDHVRTLGGTIPEIAWHKAGIIKPGRPVVTTVADPAALAVIEREAATQRSPLVTLAEGRDFTVLGTGPTGTELLDGPSGRRFRLPLPGRFQGANAAAAIGAVRQLRDLPGAIDDDLIAAGLARTRFPGRLEIVQQRPVVILDGAHNPDKMRSLVESLPLLGTPRRRVVVLGALEGHDFRSVARIIAAVADEVIVTAPRATERASAPGAEIVAVIAAAGRPVEVRLDADDALAAALDRVGPDDQIVVTGSLYLVGMARERWYPSPAIVVQRTSFPVPAATDRA